MHSFYSQAITNLKLTAQIALILRTFVSVANERSLDIDAHWETTKHTKNIQGESSSPKITK